MTATQEAQYTGQGYLTPLNDLIKENMPNFSALMENDPQIEKLISQNDGTIYSCPASTSATTATTPRKCTSTRPGSTIWDSHHHRRVLRSAESLQRAGCQRQRRSGR
ncbi:MAG: hypothetical protein ACLR2E_22390 [Lachnospiraceae bacterium]